MAHTKAGGSTSLGRDSHSKRLGIKKSGGQSVLPGNIIVRQRGSKFRSGNGTMMGSDDTIFATAAGVVQFTKRKISRFTGAMRNVKIISVVAKE